MWKLIITDDQGEHTTVNLVREEYRMGRGEENPIRLTERNVSRRHAVLRRTPGGFSITDAGSMCGTFVNGVRVHREQPLGHRDLVQLGDYRIEVIDEALDTQEQGHGPLPGDAATMPPARLPHRLVVLIGPAQGAEYALEGDRLLIGRDDDCDVKIDHGSVSRIHAEIRRLGDDHFEVIDKGSANGLRINGHDRQRAVLDGRDVVELGDVVLKYIPKGQVFRVDAAEGERIAAMSGGAMSVKPNDSRLPLGVPLLAALGGALLVGAGALLLFLRGMPGETADAADAPAELASAIELHRRGEVFRAHEEVVRLAATRPLSGQPDLIVIEAAWATAMMQAAAAEPDPGRKRELLSQVSATSTVPIRERERAAEALASLTEADQPGQDQPGQDQPGQDQPGQDQPGQDEAGAEGDQPGTAAEPADPARAGVDSGRADATRAAKREPAEVGSAADSAPLPVDNAEDVGSLPEEVSDGEEP